MNRASEDGRRNALVLLIDTCAHVILFVVLVLVVLFACVFWMGATRLYWHGLERVGVVYKHFLNLEARPWMYGFAKRAAWNVVYRFFARDVFGVNFLDFLLVDGDYWDFISILAMWTCSCSLILLLSNANASLVSIRRVAASCVVVLLLTVPGPILDVVQQRISDVTGMNSVVFGFVAGLF